MDRGLERLVTDEQKKKALETIPFVLLAQNYPAKRIANGSFRLCCVFHEETVPSMSVRKTPAGDWTFRCFACGEKGDSITFAMKYLGVGYAAAVAALTGEVDERPRIVDTYDYIDENNDLLYQVVRYVPKDFRMRRKTPTGWSWTMHDEDGRAVRRVIYKLPWIIQQPPGSTVFYLEGEKDVKTFESHGFVATTHAGGADSFRPELLKQIPKHCKIVVVPDNDDPGKGMMRKIWAAAADTGHKRSFVLLPDKYKDASDYFEAGEPDEIFVREMQ